MKATHFLVSVAGAALALATQSASAQDAPAGAKSGNGDVTEIVVTANKREQRLNSVGLTIQAASGAELAQRGVSGPADLAKLVPGFTFTQSIYSTPVYTLRGIGLYDATFGAAPSVSVYSDQVPRNVPVMSDALDLDIERVEVLKGPQGTLFGQSSTGGAINYIVGKPTKDLHAGFDASYERFGKVSVGGFVSGPVGDSVQVRLAAKGESGGAWQYSLSRPNDVLGATRKLEGRLTVDIEPASNVKIELMATGARDHSDPQAPQYTGTIYDIYGSQAQLAASGNRFGYVDAARYTAFTSMSSAAYAPSFLSDQSVLVGRLNGANPGYAAGAAAVLGTPIATDARGAEWTQGLLGPSKNNYYQFSGRIDYNITPTLTITSVTALARKDLNYGQSLDGTTATDANVSLFGNVRSFNQELRLAGNTDRLHWILGGSYDNIRTVQDNYYYLNDYSANDGVIDTTLNDFSSKMESYGIFGNAEYKLTDHLTALGGVRYTDNKQSASYCYNDPAIDTGQGVAFIFGQFLNNPPISIQPGQCFPIDANYHSSITPVDQSLSEHNVSFRAGLNYKLDQGALLYATVSQGYKAGMFSAIGASRISQYTPATQEKVLAYEAGVKTPLFGHLAQFNAAAFYYDYSNKQVRGRIADPIFGLLEKMLNVPKSRIYGLEGELVVRPIDALHLSLSGTYLNSKVTSDYSQTPDGAAVYNAEGYTGDFKGAELPYTPKFSGNIDAQYSFPAVGTTKGFVGGTLVYQGKENATFGTSALPADQFTIDSYATLDLRGGIEAANGSWRVQVYGRNVTNTLYNTAISAYLDTSIRFRGRPAVYGASFSIRY